MEFEKQTGTVAWFSARKGYGFITPDDKMEEKDIFVHFSELQMEGYKQLQAGDRVEFGLKDSDRGDMATEVVVTSRAEESAEDQS